jgi:hypothetical protein
MVSWPLFCFTGQKRRLRLRVERRLGISYPAAWRMKQKLMQVMLEREEEKKLSGFIELDDAYLGGEKPGTRGRGSENKTPFIAAVQTTSACQPEMIKLYVVDGFRSKSIKKWAEGALENGSTVISDGLACFNAVTDAGCSHERIVCGGGRASVEEPEFYWVNTVLGNLKVHYAVPTTQLNPSMHNAILLSSNTASIGGTI